MEWAHVVRHGIQHQLHTAGMQSLGQLLQIAHRSIVLVHGVVVGGMVAVVRLGSVVLIYGCGPNSGRADLLQIVEVLLDAAEIAAVPALGLGPLRSRFRTARGIPRQRSIVACIAIGETIGKDQVHDISCGEARHAGAGRAPRGEGVRLFGMLFASLHTKLHSLLG